MCLILLAYRAHPDFDVVLAGNRDEFYARPSAPPAVIGRDPVIHAGRDLEAGGTWMGRNAHGVLAALTNRRDPGFVEPPGVRSRGALVQALLEASSVEEAAARMAREDSARYRPFNVLFGGREAFYALSSAQPSELQPLKPGFYALSNSTLDDRSWPKVNRSHRFFEEHGALDGERLMLALQAFLCDPTPPDALPPADRDEEIHGPLGAVFIQTPGYGTVSASIITQGGALGDRYYFAGAEAMRAAQGGWAGTPVPAAGQGSPFRLLTFED